MSSEVKRWWDERKILWYERAAYYSSFHNNLANILADMLSKHDSIMELGCGLGYLSEKLYKQGYDIKAYDIDTNVIERAKIRTGFNIYYTSDCYTLDKIADIVLMLFFGRIADDDNYQKLSKLARKEIIYITGGGAARHTSTVKVDSFLKEKNAHFEKLTTTLPFPQPLVDEKEVDEYLNTYYEGALLEKKRKKIKPCNIEGFKYLLENNKEITIYRIYKGDEK